MKIHAFGPIASSACGPREQHADASSCGLSRLARQDLDPGWMSTPPSLRPYQVLIGAHVCVGIPLCWLWGG
jgi:hypothetical protein